MRSYHLTPEQALKLFDEAGGILDIDDKCPLAVSATDLANTINAALDKVLGEPVGEVIGKDWKALQFLPSVKRSKVNGLPAGTKLYAPKGLTLG